MQTTERTEISLLEKKLKKGFLGSKSEKGETFIFVSPESIESAVQTLKDEAHYDYFVECVGVDYLTWKHKRDLDKRFEVVYNLFSTKTSSRIFLKVIVDEGESIPTLKNIFLGAEYPEREIQDLYGVVFSGNEATKGERFLLPDDWIGFPLRKDVSLGGEDVHFHEGTEGPAVEDVSAPHAGESWEGKAGTKKLSGR